MGGLVAEVVAQGPGDEHEEERQDACPRSTGDYDAVSRADRQADDSPSRLGEGEGEEVDPGHAREQPARSSRAGRHKEEAGDHDRRNELSREIVRDRRLASQPPECSEPVAMLYSDVTTLATRKPWTIVRKPERVEAAV